MQKDPKKSIDLRNIATFFGRHHMMTPGRFELTLPNTLECPWILSLVQQQGFQFVVACSITPKKQSQSHFAGFMTWCCPVIGDVQQALPMLPEYACCIYIKQLFSIVTPSLIILAIATSFAALSSALTDLPYILRLSKLT